jgi:hypothetical protein
MSNLLKSLPQFVMLLIPDLNKSAFNLGTGPFLKTIAEAECMQRARLVSRLWLPIKGFQVFA